jgi:hypothetical protein
MNPCYCILRHAVSPQERVWVKEALEDARRRGDSVGIKVCLARLSPCPAQDPKPKRIRNAVK